LSTPPDNIPDLIVAPLPGTPEYDAAMAEVFEKAQTPETGVEQPATTTKAERPANLPEQFWDAEKGVIKHDELLASYDELAKKGAPKADDKADANVPPQQAEAAAALAEVGLAYDKYEAEYRDTGKISDASYAEMAAKNIPRAVVDAHISGLITSAETATEAARNSVFEAIGGEAKYAELVTWAAANVPREELIAYNEITESGDPAKVKLAAVALFSKYEAAVGRAPELLTGGTGKGTSTDVYRSTQELTADMKNPLYNRDPAFRADVEAKLARSNIM